MIFADSLIDNLHLIKSLITHYTGKKEHHNTIHTSN